MVAVDVTFLGEEDEARALLTALDPLPRPVSDSRGVMSVAELGAITAEPLPSVRVRHLGGAFARSSDSPHGPLAEPFALYPFGIPTDPATGRAVAARQRALVDGLPVGGREPLTCPNPDETAADAFGPAAPARLRDVRRRLDPDTTFRSNVPVLG